MRHAKLFWIALCLMGCSTTGSTVLSKGADTATGSANPSNSNTPAQPEYTSWSGERTVVFPDLCVFTITETGRRLTDPDNELVQLIELDCPLCQIYEIENTPESVECGDLGTLVTGGLRYRVLSFKEQYADGTLNIINGPVELWHAIEPLWQLDYITDAEFNDVYPGDASQWLYEATNNFQAFRYAEAGSFILSDVP